MCSLVLLFSVAVAWSNPTSPHGVAHDEMLASLVAAGPHTLDDVIAAAARHHSSEEADAAWSCWLEGVLSQPHRRHEGVVSDDLARHVRAMTRLLASTERCSDGELTRLVEAAHELDRRVDHLARPERRAAWMASTLLVHGAQEWCALDGVPTQQAVTAGLITGVVASLRPAPSAAPEADAAIAAACAGYLSQLP